MIYMAKKKPFLQRLWGAIPEIPWIIYSRMAHAELLNFVPDELHLKICYRLAIHKKLDLENPKGFTDKLQWLKLYNRNPEHTRLVDKCAVKPWIAEKIGQQYVIPTLGEWENFDDINFDALPDQFVLKCNHDSGGLVICKDKSKLDIAAARKKINKSLKRNFYSWGREWPYKNIPRKILCEKYMDEGTGEALTDYKVLCFGGKPKLFEMHNGRFTDHHTQDFYDTEWNLTEYHQVGDQYSTVPMERPACLEEMLELSEKLAEGLPQVRVDWYYIQGQVYFGEITLFDGSGLDPFEKNYDEVFGSWIPLPEKRV